MGSREILKNGNTTVCLCDDGNDQVGTEIRLWEDTQ